MAKVLLMKTPAGKGAESRPMPVPSGFTYVRESSGFVKPSSSSVPTVNNALSVLWTEPRRSYHRVHRQVFNRPPTCASDVLPPLGTVATVEGVMPSASVITFSCVLEPAVGFCSSLQFDAIVGQQSQTSGLSAIDTVC